MSTPATGLRLEAVYHWIGSDEEHEPDADVFTLGLGSTWRSRGH